ncbi:hypothetical protein Pint_09587 [Pistacia integerrima]|uniref:Uncharacterized protein n=1 Tax=Pistacia integerrima TaxID=434235 RepID=A0ACC0XH13_9ROSI|nr:hypothetical protein Pint_09587 [Pistacia integerrima]
MDNSLFDNNKPYQAALDDRWDELKNMYNEENAWALSSPLSAAKDTVFHLAAFSKSEEPLHCLLNIAKKDTMTKYEYLGKNDYVNTALHEAAANGNIKAVKLLVNHNKKLLKEDGDPNYTEFLEDLNKEGETPLFKAAAYGRTKVVKFLAQESLGQLIKIGKDVGKEEDKECTKLKDIHYKNICLTKIEPQPDASNLTGAIKGEIILEFKPDASNLPGAFQRKILLVPKPNASNLSGPTQKEIFKAEPDASILHVAIRGRHFETALHLLNLDKSLAELKDIKGYTSLHLLATIPSAFKSGYRWGIWINRVLYFCLPIGEDENGNSCLTTCLSIGDDADDEKPTRCLTTGISIVYDVDDEKDTSSNISKGWLILLAKIFAPERKICEEKRKHKLAFKLTERLIEVDTSWKEQIAEALPTSSTSSDSDEQEYIKIKRPAEVDNKPIPLLLATERGIVEIVNKILEQWPQLVEYKNHLNQNILHVAIKHRQSEIFDSVKNMKIPMTRLVRVVDTNGYTILHHAAYMEHETTEIHPAGPVYELQEEIKWYKRVEKITPSHYAMLRDKKENKTCEELFKSNHNELLRRAQSNG